MQLVLYHDSIQQLHLLDKRLNSGLNEKPQNNKILFENINQLCMERNFNRFLQRILFAIFTS